MNNERNEDIVTDQTVEGSEVNHNENRMPEIPYGGDSTCVTDIKILMDDDQGEELGDPELHKEVHQYLEISSRDSKKQPREKLEEGLSLTQRFYPQMMKQSAANERAKTLQAFTLGEMLIIQKNLVILAGLKWLDWSNANLAFMSERTRQDYMLLASRDDARERSYLGIHRLLVLISATKDLQGDDPIGYFLDQFGLDIDPDDAETPPISEFKLNVDTAIAVMKARKAKLEPEFALMRPVIELGIKITNKHVGDMVLIEKHGGNSNEYLRRLHANKGKLEALFPEEKRVEGFSKGVERLSETLEFILKNPSTAKTVNISKVNELEVQLSELKKMVAAN